MHTLLDAITIEQSYLTRSLPLIPHLFWLSNISQEIKDLLVEKVARAHYYNYSTLLQLQYVKLLNKSEESSTIQL